MVPTTSASTHIEVDADDVVDAGGRLERSARPDAGRPRSIRGVEAARGRLGRRRVFFVEVGGVGPGARPSRHTSSLPSLLPQFELSMIRQRLPLSGPTSTRRIRIVRGSPCQGQQGCWGSSSREPRRREILSVRRRPFGRCPATLFGTGALRVNEPSDVPARPWVAPGTVAEVDGALGERGLLPSAVRIGSGLLEHEW